LPEIVIASDADLARARYDYGRLSELLNKLRQRSSPVNESLSRCNGCGQQTFMALRLLEPFFALSPATYSQRKCPEVTLVQDYGAQLELIDGVCENTHCTYNPERNIWTFLAKLDPRRDPALAEIAPQQRADVPCENKECPKPAVFGIWRGETCITSFCSTCRRLVLPGSLGQVHCNNLNRLEGLRATLWQAICDHEHRPWARASV
jgi:hypothetical protein